MFFLSVLAGREGFEPPQARLELAMLPLHQRPKLVFVPRVGFEPTLNRF